MRAAIDDTARRLLDRRLVEIVATPGAELASLAVLVAQDGHTVYEGSFGARSIAPAAPTQNLPATPNTKFRVASISKAVAALGALQLAEQGRLALDCDVSDYLGFLLRNPHFPDRPITTRMLLTHTSSLRDGAAYSIPLPYALQDFFLPYGAFYEDGAHFALPAPNGDTAPGRFFAYCNLNFGVLATVLERVTGERFDRLMRRRILEPLGIDGGYSVHDLSESGFHELATLYRKAQDGIWNPQGAWFPQVDDYRGVRPAEVVRVENPDTGDPIQRTQSAAPLANYQVGTNGTLFSPQGGLRISARDLARIMAVFLDEDGHADTRIVSPSTIREMLTVQWQFDPATRNGDNYGGLMTAWGLGLQHFPDHVAGRAGQGDWWGHLGEAYGLLSGMLFERERRFGYIYLIGGVGADPDSQRGRVSAFSRWEEEIQIAIRQAFIDWQCGGEASPGG